MWIDTLGAKTSGTSGGALARRRGGAAESDCGDLLQARQRDGDQRHQKDDAETERKSGAGHEIMALPERDDGGEPGADRIGGNGQHQRLGDAHPCHGQDRQRQQQPKQHR